MNDEEKRLACEAWVEQACRAHHDAGLIEYGYDWSEAVIRGDPRVAVWRRQMREALIAVGFFDLVFHHAQHHGKEQESPMTNPPSLWEDAERHDHWHICSGSGALCGANLADVSYCLPDFPFLNINLCLDCWEQLAPSVARESPARCEERRMKKPRWWPKNPYPRDIFPMPEGRYAEIVPDPDLRTALSGMLGRRFWDAASEAIWEAMLRADGVLEDLLSARYEREEWEEQR